MDLYKKIDIYQSILNEEHPFEEPLLKQIKEYYKIRLTWSSNALDGNNLTEIETKILIEDNLSVGGKPLRDIYEAIGHAKAYEYMFSLLHVKEIAIQEITSLHRLLYKEIDESNAGTYRKKKVFITGAVYPLPNPEDIEEEMKMLTDWIDKKRNNYHPVEFAALLHKKFVYICPFIKGNGQVARLLMNMSLIQDGYMMAVILPILRSEYLGHLKQVRKDDRSFLQFIAERVMETQKNMLQLLHLSIPIQKIPSQER